MMKFFSSAALAALVSLAALPAAAASLVNGDFSAGKTGWTDNGKGGFDVVTSATEGDNFTTFAFPSSQPFALLTAGGPVDDPETISQNFDLATGGTVSFSVAFLGFDTSDFDDNAFVTVTNLDTNHVTTLFSDDILHAGDNSTDGPISFSQVFAAGRYSFTAGVQNVGDDPADPNFDSSFSSKVAVTGVTVTSGAVPEPASWALLIAGFAGLGGALRARRSAVRAA